MANINTLRQVLPEFRKKFATLVDKQVGRLTVERLFLESVLERSLGGAVATSKKDDISEIVTQIRDELGLRT